MASGARPVGGTGADRRRIIRIMPVEFGYGPLGKALHVARAIRGLVGDSVRIELVASTNFRSPVDAGLFDESMSSIAAAAHADAVVTMMNVKGIAAAAARGEKVYVVDSLAWLWDEPLQIRDLIYVYFYQDLPVLPVPARNIAGMPNATPIAAIGRLPVDVRHASLAPAEPRFDGGTVVSLSGIEAPGSRLGWDALAYPPYILEALEYLVERGRLDATRLALFGNSTVLRHFAGRRLSPMLRAGSQGEFGAVARSAGSVVCPPGLTTIVECLRSGVSLKLLPPQNYSQVKVMKAFSGPVGIPAMSWGGAVEPWLQEATLPESVGAEIVRGVVSNARLANRHADPDALMSLLEHESPALDRSTVDRLIGPGDGELAVAERVLSDVLR
jgi:hypothetical protein